MVIADATLLGFNRDKQYFEGDIFAKGDILTVTVEGLVEHLNNTNTNDISSTVSQGLKDIFDPTSNSSLSNYNLSQGLAVDDVTINNVQFGKGKILSVSMTSNPSIKESKIFIGKYEITFQFLHSIGSANFHITGQTGDDVYTDGIETILEPYAHRLTTFSESFDFNRSSSSGGENYTHNINIKLEDDGVRPQANISGTTIPATPENIATYIAWKIYNSPHSYLPRHWAKTFNLTSGTGAAMTAPHDGFFSESINTVSGECRFSKKWEKNLGLTTASINNAVNTGFNGLYHFEYLGAQYCAKRSYTITNNKAAGITCTERGDVTCVGKGLDANGNRKIISDISSVFKLVGEGARTRCQDAVDKIVGTGHTLIDVNLEAKFIEVAQENRFGYEVTFTSDSNVVNTYAGFKIERKVSTSRDSEGINTFEQENRIVPIMQASLFGQTFFTDTAVNRANEFTTNHTIDKLMDLLLGKFLPRANYYTNNSANASSDFGWARYFYDIGVAVAGSDFKKISSDTSINPKNHHLQARGNSSGIIECDLHEKRERSSYEISIKETWTDDPAITQQWMTDNTDITSSGYKSFFTQKEMSVDDDNPVRKKESYMIAGWGEVVHASMQSDLGTVTIKFEGTLARDMAWNSIINGVPLSTTYLKLAIREAVVSCMQYFGIRNAAMIFITDTSYDFSSSRELSLNVTLNYTRESLTSALETRI
ncbi:MAG: hypothetical protein H8E05_01215 [Bacteroidetes bacterium]|nr:hypothetical protein [Bacteroidota bacterium]